MDKEMVELVLQKQRVDDLVVTINLITRSEKSFPILGMTKDFQNNLFNAKKSLLEYSRVLDEKLR